MNRPARFDGHIHELRAAVWALLSIAVIATPKTCAHIAHRRNR